MNNDTQKRSLAIFDLDETLLSIDSDHAWGQFLVDQQLVNVEDFRKRNDEFYRQYKSGNLDVDAYYRFSSEILTLIPPENLETVRRHFIEEIVSPHILPSGLDLIESHRKKGHYLLLITATLEFITAPIAELLGIPHLIAPVPESINGIYTGKLAGVPSFREGKLIRLNQWLDKNLYSLEESYFYTDSFNDLPLLEAVGIPVVVDPDDKLLAVARERDWQIISLRGNRKV